MAAVHILFDRAVFAYILAELRKHPDTEEGGKYVGYVLSPCDPRLARFGIEGGAPAIVVTDFLPSGPNAIRTPVELVPDGEYQEAMFRQLERLEPAIEHVGTWHSHHCNGLPSLSPGDIKGYRRTVNRQEYRLDFFLASLVKHLPCDVSDRAWIDHFLFARGRDDYYCINESIQIVDWPTTFGRHTGHLDVSRTPTPTEVKPSRDEGVEERPGVSWYETALGRRILSEDKSLFKDTFRDGVTATRRGDVITLTGRRGHASIGVMYPSAAGGSDVTVVLREDDTRILEITCDLKHRNVALKAALVAFESR